MTRRDVSRALNPPRPPSLRQIQGNLFSPRLPGGNFISALLDRRLMSWSDRGGASRVLGERWSEQCWSHLQGQIGCHQAVPFEQPFRLEAVVRLDEHPEIAIQAGNHKLVNPDFVLIGETAAGRQVLQAADAKFAVDTIKPHQVSAESLSALLEVEAGLVRRVIEAWHQPFDLATVEVVRGVFFSPLGPLTDFFLPRVLVDARRSAVVEEVVLLPVDAAAMFVDLPVTPLLAPLAELDRLPVNLADEILPAIYYFRLASACAWMWVEARTPLLSLDPPPQVDDKRLLLEVTERTRRARSSFGMLEDWHREIEKIAQARAEVARAARLPIRMPLFNELAAEHGLSNDRRAVRHLRGAAERRYRRLLIERLGELPAQSAEPLEAIVRRIDRTSRELAPELLAFTREAFRRAGSD